MGDQKAVARALSNLANVVKLQGDYAGARRYMQNVLRFSGAGRSNGRGMVTELPGRCCARTGRFRDGAELCTSRALAIFREIGDRWGIAGTLADLGNLARETERITRQRIRFYRESLEIFQELEQKRGVARLLECFACSAAAQLEGGASLRLAGAAAALRQNIGAPLDAGGTGQVGSDFAGRAAGADIIPRVRQRGWKAGRCRSRKSLRRADDELAESISTQQLRRWLDENELGTATISPLCGSDR